MELIDDDYQNKSNSFSQEAGGGKVTVRALKCVRVYVGDGVCQQCWHFCTRGLCVGRSRGQFQGLAL